ncbi:MAG: type III pantothenate kinase [Mycoplasmatales bacterium]
MYYIDIGNSFAKILHDGKLKTIETKDVIKFMKNKDNIIVSCVQQSTLNKIRKIYPDIKILDNRIYDKLINIDSDLIYKKGSDRIVAGFGAMSKYGDSVIVIDLGTTLTVDVFINRTYKSGYIFPGLNLLRQVLHNKVPQLPDVVLPISKTKDVVDTNDQIFWGHIYGMTGTINQLISIEQEKYGKDIPIIFSGGSINDFNQFLERNEIDKLFTFEYTVDSDIIFEAMRIIDEKNI